MIVAVLKDLGDLLSPEQWAFEVDSRLENMTLSVCFAPVGTESYSEETDLKDLLFSCNIGEEIPVMDCYGRNNPHCNPSDYFQYFFSLPHPVTIPESEFLTELTLKSIPDRFNPRPYVQMAKRAEFERDDEDGRWDEGESKYYQDQDISFKIGEGPVVYPYDKMDESTVIDPKLLKEGLEASVKYYEGLGMVRDEQLRYYF